MDQRLHHLHQGDASARGAVEEASEVLLIIKTSGEKVSELETALRELHSYDVPEFLVLGVAGGSRPYLDWLFAQVDTQGFGHQFLH